VQSTLLLILLLKLCIFRFLLYTKATLEKTKYQKVHAFDETSVWFDSVGDTTVDKIGVEDVCLASTGHEI
jgi:hypothetical protein